MKWFLIVLSGVVLTLVAMYVAFMVSARFDRNESKLDDHEERLTSLEGQDLVRAVEAACGPKPQHDLFAIGAGTAEDPYRWESLATIVRQESQLFIGED